MRSKIILAVLLLQMLSFGYELVNSWLATPGSYAVYLTPEVNNLKATWGLNFSNCISAANAHSVINAPALDSALTTSENANCIVKYEPFSDPPSSVAICRRTAPGQYFSFEVIVNELEYNPTTYGIYNINAIITHELVHSLGIADNSDPTTLMYGTAGNITSLTNDEINGIRNVYEKPKVEIYSKHQAIDNTSYAILENDTVEFILRGIDFLEHNAISPPKVLIDSYFMEIDELEKYTGTLDTLAYNIYKLKMSANMINSTENYKKKINRLRNYQHRDSINNVWFYKQYNSPCSLITFNLMPECYTRLSLDSTASSSKYYSFDDKYYFSATCVDSSGADYPNLQDIKFYYKEGSATSYTEITTKDPMKYNCYWNSGSYKGEVTIKAVASFLLESGSSVVLKDADSLTIRILDGFECKITEPNAYNVEAIDFEKYLRIAGDLYHDGSVDTDTVQTGIIVRDKLNNWAPLGDLYYDEYACPGMGKYSWFASPLPWPSSAHLKEGTASVKASVAAFLQSTDSGNSMSKSTVKSDSVLWDDLNKGVFRIKPGIYKIEGYLYDKHYIYPIAKPDTLWALKPSWKMKLHGDPWYQYSRTPGYPYREKTIYAPEEGIKMYIWRPFIERTITPVQFNITHENISIANLTTGADAYDQYIFEEKPDSYNSLGWVTYNPDTFFVSTKTPAVWSRTGNEAPGFYQINATEVDPLTGYNVIQKKEVQIPPLYITAESDGIGWPESLWPRGAEYEDMENEDNWTVTNLYPYSREVGSNSLTAYYKSKERKGKYELVHPGVKIEKNHSVEFQFAIALKKELVPNTNDYRFEKLIANYTIALDIGGEEIPIKQATVEEWDKYDALDRWNGDGNDSIFYFVKFTTPLGESAPVGSIIKVKLITEGLNDFYVDSLEQSVLFDEICINYTRKFCPKGPAMAYGYYKSSKGIDCVEISFDAPTGSPVQPKGYVIYRDGVEIAKITNTSYIDMEIESNKTYKYAITAEYDGLDYPESSLLDCTFSVTTGEITYPRPKNVVLTTGIDNDYNSVYLEWDEPLGDSLSFYNVFRNDILITTTTDSVYSDLWLPDGLHSYSLSATYPGGFESEWTEPLEIEIISPAISDPLPVIEDFENGGEIPESWILGYWWLSLLQHPYNRWQIDSSSYTVTNAPSGTYFSWIGTGPFTNSAVDDDTVASDGIISPLLNLSGYKNVNISLKYSIAGYQGIEERPSNFINFVLVNTDFSTDWETYMNMNELLSIDSIGPAKYTQGWESLNIPIDNSLLNDKVQLGIFAQVDNYDNPINKKLYLYYGLDSIVVSGTIKAEIPGNLVIAENQGAMEISWDAVTGATNYYVYRSRYPDTGYQEIGTTTSPYYSDDLTELDDGVHFYKVISEVAQKIYQSGQNNGLIRHKEVKR